VVTRADRPAGRPARQQGWRALLLLPICVSQPSR
jgi:hypothetical protein